MRQEQVLLFVTGLKRTGQQVVRDCMVASHSQVVALGSSRTHSLLQPSLLKTFPSSHSSVPSLIPFWQTVVCVKSQMITKQSLVVFRLITSYVGKLLSMSGWHPQHVEQWGNVLIYMDWGKATTRKSFDL